jgi:hypothetical protein
VRYVIRPTLRAGWAVLRDISAGEVQLTLPCRVEAGAVLLLELTPAVAQDGTFCRAVGVSARRGDWGSGGGWCVACRFLTPLSEQELTAARQQFQGPR